MNIDTVKKLYGAMERITGCCVGEVPSTTVVKREGKPCDVCSDTDEQELGVPVAKRTKRGDEGQKEVCLQAEKKRAVALREG